MRATPNEGPMHSREEFFVASITEASSRSRAFSPARRETSCPPSWLGTEIRSALTGRGCPPSRFRKDGIAKRWDKKPVISTGADHREALICEVERPAVERS